VAAFRKIVFALLAAQCIGAIAVQAQVCQGSLGDPLINISFGAGTNPGPPLAAATTNYQYSFNDCPPDGSYTVRNNTANCFGNTWHNLSADHTGNPNGYFMLVNASFQPGIFYLDTVKGLCTGTTYEFAAWIANVLRSTACNSSGIQPNLTLTIERTDGTVIATYATGNIPNPAAPAWQQYGFFFATPAGVSDIVLKMVNNSPGGCGNDIALDDITFRPCGPQITIHIVGSTETEVTFCEGTARSFTLGAAIFAGFNNPEARWQRSINGGPWTDIVSIPPYIQDFPATTPPGTYAFRMSAAEQGNINSLQCRVASPPITIKVVARPVTTATINSPQCENSSLLLSATGGTIYQWTGPNSFTASGADVSIPNAQSNHSGKYYVLVTNADGCTHLDSVTATVNVNPVATTSFFETHLCEGESITLGSSGGGTYQWIPATGLSSSVIPGPVATPADTTLYSVVVTNQYGCTDTATTKVNVVEKPRADAGPDKHIIRGKSTQLAAIATGQGISYSWSPALYINDPLLLQPVVTPPLDTDYLLTVVSNEGCGVATDMVRVFVYPDVYIPTAFSPNDDGLNDTWAIPALRAYAEYTVSVYNRYGQLLFHTRNNMKPWDGKFNGKPQPPAAYVYVIDIKDEKKLLKGILVIVR
jgi:gliding motility-associated-like protein